MYPKKGVGSFVECSGEGPKSPWGRLCGKLHGAGGEAFTADCTSLSICGMASIVAFLMAVLLAF